MAKLIKTIFGVPDGEIYPRDIPEGEDCPPGLEAYAESIGAIDGAEAEAARLKAEANEAAAKAQAEAEAASKAETEAKAQEEEAAKAAKKAPETK